jgi:hypothetical protein
MKKLYSILTSLIAATAFSHASVLTLEDFDFTLLNPAGTALTAPYSNITGLWGTYSSGVFTPLITSTPNAATNSGYAALAGDDMLVNLSQSNNNLVVAGATLSISFYKLEEGSTYSSTVDQIVLTDPTWIAPTFVFGTGSNSVSFTSSTSTQLLSGFQNAGTYTYNDGTESLRFASAVPEPSTYALMAVGAVGLFLSFRRRKVQA